MIRTDISNTHETVRLSKLDSATEDVNCAVHIVCVVHEHVRRLQMASSGPEVV